MNAPAQSEYTLIPLLGRAAQMMGQRMIQVFGSVATDSTPDSYIPELQTGIGWPSAHYDVSALGTTTRCERLWRVSSAGQSVQRRVDDGVLSSLPFGDFNPSNLPAASSFAPNGFFKLALDIGRATGNARYLMDVGESLDIYAYAVDVYLIGPTGTIEITPTVAGSAGVGNLLVDARLGVDCAPIESPIGNRSFKFTQHFAVAAGAQASIQIPRSAVAMKIYQSPAGPNSGDWTRFIGDPAILSAAFPTGVVTFVSRTNIDAHQPIGDETHLQTDLDAANNRLFTIVWEIRP